MFIFDQILEDPYRHQLRLSIVQQISVEDFKSTSKRITEEIVSELGFYEIEYFDFDDDNSWGEFKICQKGQRPPVSKAFL